MLWFSTKNIRSFKWCLTASSNIYIVFLLCLQLQWRKHSWEYLTHYEQLNPYLILVFKMRTQKIYFWQKGSYQILLLHSVQNESNLLQYFNGKCNSHEIRAFIPSATVRKMCPCLISWKQYCHHCNTSNLQKTQPCHFSAVPSTSSVVQKWCPTNNYWFCYFVLFLTVLK